MTTADLHKILDSDNRKLSLDELKQVIYELKQDAFTEFGKALETKTQNRQEIRNIGFYDGEQNAFQICLDLLERFGESKLEPKYKVGDTVYIIDYDYSAQPNPQKRVFPCTVCKVYVGKKKVSYGLVGLKNRYDEPYVFADKESAESRLNGDEIKLPYLLCTSNKFACVIWRDKDGKVKKTYTMPIEEAKGVLKEKNHNMSNLFNLDFLKNAETFKITYVNADQIVDKNFVKVFRKKNDLTQVALANILGVKKKTIEKWEQGEKKIGEIGAILLFLLYQHPELIAEIYSIKKN